MANFGSESGRILVQLEPTSVKTGPSARQGQTQASLRKPDICSRNTRGRIFGVISGHRAPTSTNMPQMSTSLGPKVGQNLANVGRSWRPLPRNPSKDASCQHVSGGGSSIVPGSAPRPVRWGSTRHKSRSERRKHDRNMLADACLKCSLGTERQLRSNVARCCHAFARIGP